MTGGFDGKHGPRKQQNETEPDATSVGKATLTQSVPARQSQAAAPASEPSAITAPVGSLAHRVQTAAAANDVAQVIAIQTELLQQQRTDEVNQAIVAARHWLMERVAAIRAQYAPRLHSAQAHSRAVPGGGLQKVEAVEIEMDRACAPLLSGLEHGDPTQRYHHTSKEITAQVFSAVRLHGARHSTNHIDDAWAKQGKGGFLAALSYNHPTKWIWTGDRWMGIRDYHLLRDSVRYYVRRKPGRPRPLIEPGDLLIEDDIDTALTADGEHVQTTDGKSSCVDGVGRMSIVDYEHHEYSSAETMPTEPPVRAK